MIRGPHHRALASAIALALATGLTASCSLFGSTPEPDDAAAALATGLAKGDVAGVAFAGTKAENVTTFLAKAYKGMDALRPKVEVKSVSGNEDGTRAKATLHTTWSVAGIEKPWSYDSEAELKLVDNVWRVTWTPALVAPDLSPDEGLTVVRTWPRRADIVDHNGAKLMTEREVEVVGLDKTKLATAAEARQSALALAGVLGINGEVFAARVASAGANAFVDGLSVRATDPTLASNRARIDAVKGGLRLPQLKVLGPTRTWAAPILGTVAEATAEQIQKSNGDLRAGDLVGQNGLQLRYDKDLRGTPGVAVQAVKRGADGSVLHKRELFAEASHESEPLKLTLDEKAQTAAEAALAAQATLPTALVVVRVSTGEVLAAAVGPGAKGAPLALAGKNAPGSTFKIASSLALIRKGATAETKLPCTDALTVNGRLFGNYSHYPKAKLGQISLKTALAYSCNTAFISQYKTVSQSELIAAADSLGMGQDLTLPFTGFVGSVPPTDDVVEHAASFIGQGKVEASPLTMALVVASVMKGETVRPALITGAGGTLPAPTTPLNAAEAEVLRQEMHAVVTEGSGKSLAQVGVQFAKTGTAEFGTSNPPKTHAWMIAGFGDIAIAAYNEEGPSGSTHAGPFIIDLLKHWKP